MRTDKDLNKDQTENDIAIIGMACRFPGNVNAPQEFWNFLLAGGDGIVEVPADRWENAAYYDANKERQGRMYVNRGGFIRGIDQFDPQFFGISPKEAPHIDPQHRWLLELTYEALESAGLKAGDLKGSDTAVYIGQFMHDYEQMQLDAAAHKLMSSHTATGPSMTLTSNRISYSFDFTGPSVTLDTACSSSLVALDMACKALLNGDSHLAIAGGVNILLRPELTMSICKASMLSPDGRCKSFDASANGYVRSEGAGVVLVKKLADAMRDGDPILAVIKATGVNQDGQTVGITVPNGESQKKLLKQSLGRAGIAPQEIQYAEAHGTGTAVGDPIEVNALGELLGARDPDDMTCVIGSVKSNIGHMEATAGMAGLMKTVLAMDKGVIPQNIHYHTTNPAIDLEKLNVRIADQQLQWPDKPGTTRKAIVNSFGFGGTNANVVLEQAPRLAAKGADQKPVVNHELKLLPISSKTEKGLKDQANKYAEYLKRSDNTAELHDICYTASVKREHHKYRLAVSGADKTSMIQGLQDFMGGNPGASYVQAAALNGADERVVFVFSGMGPQWAGMGRELYRSERVFRAMLDRCSEALEPYTGWSLIDAVFNAQDGNSIHATYIAQPAIFAIQVALAELLKSWGITPACVVGHSAGEVGAAYVAGALDFDDAIKVIYHRSRLQHTTEGTGKMLAVGISAEALKPYLTGVEARVSIAAINSEQALTLAGDPEVLASIAQRLDEQGLFARFLNVGVPYHSPVMDRLKAPLIEVLGDIKVHAPVIPLYSTVTAQLTQDGDWGPAYWADNVREPVFFKAAIENIAAAGFSTFLEIAPHPVLSSSIEKNLDAIRKKGLIAATLKRDQDDVAMITQTLASLHTAGYPLPWATLYPNGGNFVYLPNYAWQHAAYWCESEEARKARLKNLGQRGGFSEPVHPLLGSRMNSSAAIWQKAMDLGEQSYLVDHQVEGEIVYPGAAYIETGLAVARLEGKSERITLENVEFKRAFFLDKEKAKLVETRLDESKGGFQVSAVDSRTGQWSLFSQGIISTVSRHVPHPSVQLKQLIAKFSRKLEKAEFYRHCHKLGLNYQSAFQAVEAAWHSDTECLVEIRLPESLAATAGDYLLHPSIMDGAFQALFPTIESGYLPVKIAELNYYRKPDEHCFSYYRNLYKDEYRIKGDLIIFDTEGQILVEVLGCELKSLQAQSDSAGKYSLLYDFSWRPQPLRAAETFESGQWIVLADSRGVGRKLAIELEKRAQTVCLIEAGDTLTQSGEHRFSTALNSPADIVALAGRYAQACKGVIYLRSLDADSCEALSADEMLARCQHTLIKPLYLAQALDQVNWKRQQTVYLVTQSVHQLPGDSSLPQPAQGTLWGFGRVFASEHPEHRISLVDLSAELDYKLIEQLADQVLSADYEQEVALRPGGRFINRLRKLAAAELDEYIQSEVEIAADRPFQVVQQAKGNAHEWRLQAFSLPELAATDIELRVDYAGVCRQSVGECVGTVTRTGKEVKGFAAGDRVIAFARQALASVAHANVATSVKLPEHVSAEQAATVPAAFLSAHYSLSYLAGLRAGETVLIHEAAEPVGLAAVQLAQFRQARIFATASTQEKRAYLRKLGLEYVFDSTTFEFAREIPALLQPQDQGIDVVLNALSGQFVDKTFGLLSPFGRFIELCQGEIRLNGGQWETLIERNISYHSLNITDLVNRRAELSGRLLGEIAGLLDTRQISSLPLASFPVESAAAALKALDDSSQVRKVVLQFKTPSVRVAQGMNGNVIRSQRSYLVTGGLGGLGLEIMRWLATQGAESIVLIGRSQPSANALQQIEIVRAKGVTITTLQADVAEAADVTKVLHAIEEKLPPLAGIIHSAGVLEDGTIAQQDAEKYRKVLVPKVKGAWNLHRLTSHLELDLFVCFSSIAAIVGWAGQSNYAAANTFMDTLVRYRHALGKPALSINWGPWGGSGMAANLDARDIQRMNDAGMAALVPEQGLAAMSKLLAYRVPQAGVFDLNWSLLMRQYPDPSRKTLLLDFMDSSQASGEVDFIEQLKSASAAERETILEGKIAQLLAEVLGLESASGIDRDVSVFEYGMNSLMSMDFKNRLQSMLKSKLPATLVMKYPTVNAITKYVVENALDDIQSGSTPTDNDILVWDPSHPDVVADCEINGPLEHPTAMVTNWVLQQQSSHFNVGALLEIDPSKYDLATLTTTMKILLTYHDGCRIQIFTDGEKFSQEIAPLSKDFKIEEYDFSDLEYEAGLAKMRETNARLHRSFSFTWPTPLFSMACYRLNSGNPYRFFLIFHHYISDGMSQKILSDDFGSTYLKVLDRQPVYFPKKSFLLKDWTHKLNRFAHEEAVEQIPYWKEKVEKSRLCYLPNDFNSGRDRLPEDFVATNIDITSGDYLALAEICKEQRVEIGDICIYALIKAFSKITLADSLWVDFNIHARMNVFDEIEIPKLFGQIGELSSVLFELKSENTAFQNIKLIKEQRLQVPNGGIGLRALKYLNHDAEIQKMFTIQDIPQIVINFDLINYENEDQRGWFAMASEGIGQEVTKIVEKDHMHQFLIKTTRKRGGISMSFMFWKDCFYPDTVKSLASDVLNNLIRIASSVKQADAETTTNKVEGSA